jgi:hypothetical protein
VFGELATALGLEKTRTIQILDAQAAGGRPHVRLEEPIDETDDYHLQCVKALKHGYPTSGTSPLRDANRDRPIVYPPGCRRDPACNPVTLSGGASSKPCGRDRGRDRWSGGPSDRE